MGPVIGYGIGGCVLGLVAMGSAFLVRTNDAEASAIDRPQVTEITVPMACALGIEVALSSPDATEPNGAHCQCLYAGLRDQTVASHRVAGVALLTLIAETERLAAAGTSVDLSPYFAGMDQLQLDHGLDAIEMGQLVAGVNTAIDACLAPPVV